MKALWSAFTTLLLVAVSTLPVAAMEALTLEAALQQAARNHPDLRARAAGLAIAESERVRAGIWLPDNPTFQARIGRGGEADVGATLSQPFEIAGQRRLRLDAAEAGIARAKAEIAAYRQQALADAKSAYYDLLYWQERRKLADQMLAVAGELDRIAQTRLKAADVAPVDATLVRLAFEREQARRGDVASQWRIAQAALNRMIGRPADEPTTVSGHLAPDAEPPAEAEALAQARRQRPDLQALKVEQQRLATLVTLWQREAVPNPTLSLDYDRRSDSDWHWDHPPQPTGHSLQLGVSVPIPLVDRRQAQQARTRAEQAELAARITALETAIARDVAQALTGWRLRLAPAGTYAALLPKLEENLQLLRNAYKEGQVDLQRVLLAQDQLLQGRLALLDIQRQLRQAEIQTDLALGRLTVPEEESP